MRKCFGRNKKGFEEVLDILSEAHNENIQVTNDMSKNAVKKAKKIAKKNEKSFKKAFKLLKKDKHHTSIGKSIQLLAEQDLNKVVDVFNYLKNDHRDIVLKRAVQTEDFSFIQSILKFLTDDEKLFVFNNALKANNFIIADLFGNDLDIKNFDLKQFSKEAISYLLEKDFQVSAKYVKFDTYKPKMVKQLSKHNIKVDLNNCVDILFNKALYKSVKPQLTVDNLKNIFNHQVDIKKVDQKHLRDILSNLSDKSVNNDKLIQVIFNYAVDLGIDSLQQLLKKEYGKYLRY